MKVGGWVEKAQRKRASRQLNTQKHTDLTRTYASMRDAAIGSTCDRAVQEELGPLNKQKDNSTLEFVMTHKGGWHLVSVLLKSGLHPCLLESSLPRDSLSVSGVLQSMHSDQEIQSMVTTS